MQERFIFTKHRAYCYHCGQVADQVIKAVSAQAQVTCSNCGATGIYVPRVENVETPGIFTPIDCHDLWNLTADAACKHCRVEGPHDLVIGCRHFTTRCRNCDYTHFYKLDLEFVAHCPIEIEES
ncbi:MAG: hypothetical protein KO206_01205 [Methanomicrobiaceae archaeon]|nr:hypothetical protein [Methanomicrobiaceae archaeon]